MYLCKAFWRKEDYEPAIEEGTKAIELGRKLHSEAIPDFVYTLEYLGTSLARTGRAKEAEPLVEEAFARARKTFPNGDPRISIAEGAVGECLIAQDRFAEAEPLIVHSYESLKATHTTPPVKHDVYERWRILSAKRAIELYEKWQKPDLAAKYRATP